MTDVIDFRAFIPIEKSLETVMHPPADRYVEKYHLPPITEMSMSPEQLVDYLDACGVGHMLLVGPRLTSEEIAAYVLAKPDRFTGIASVTPASGLREAVCELRRSYDLGFRLVSLRPCLDGFRASDRRYYPIYSTCAELGMAVVIHTSFQFGRGLKLDYGRPLHLDEVATDFPELAIVASHGGWPWVDEMIAVAWHHDNIYIELSGQRPAHMGKPGSGWEALFNYGSGALRSRLLWGSGSPILDLKRQLTEIRELPFKEEAITRMLEVNPRELLSRLGYAI